VQQAVDRRFNRAHYDAGKVVDEFAARLQESVDLATIRDDLASTVQDALEPAHLSIWLRLLFSSQTARAWRPGSSAPAVWQEIKDRPRRWAGLRRIRRLLPQGAHAVPSTNANVSVKAISSSG
jgi:hypothetical protein